MRNKLMIVILALILTVSVKAEVYKQVKVFATDKEAIEKLAGFDIVGYQPELYIEVIADSLGYVHLKLWDYPMEIVHEDLTAFYQSRYPAGTTMGGFRTYAEVIAVLDSLSNDYPSLVTAKTSLGLSHEGRELWMVKVSDNPYVDEDEPEIFINGLHHAREPVTVDVCIEFIKELVENYGTDPDITDLVDNNEFFIVPVLNPDGYEYNRQTNPNGGGMWRKNRRNNGGGSYGVDPNRNYPYFWSYDNSGSSGSSSSDLYRGPSPGSEPEVQAAMNFTENHDFAWVMNYHSYSNLLLWPWGYYDGVNEDVSTYNELFGNYADDTLGYDTGTAWQLLYNTNGDANDWGWGERQSKKKTYAMTIEIGSYYDGFWPSLERIPVLINENVLALLNYSYKAYEIYKRRQPPTPEIISPSAAPAGQSFYLHWQTAVVDTFNAAVSYRVEEKSGYQRITQDCEQSNNFDLDNFSLSAIRKHSGSYSLYSGQSNNRRATVTLKERLKVETGDTLTFWTYYDIETNWDYAYVEVNTNSGESWQPLNGNRSTTYDPNHRNKGYGITGSSGGWVLAEYYLDDYIGQEIDVRFRCWTDDLTVNEGIYIDDIYPYDSFSNTIVYAEYVYQESLLVSPHSAGNYAFQVSARDDRSDMSLLSKRFNVEVTGDLYSLSGYVYLDDSPADLSGSVVTVSGIGLSDTTDIDGQYMISGIPSESYNITAAHDGYHDSLYSGYGIESDTTMNFTLSPILPSQPQLLLPDDGATIDTSHVYFDWADADYADGYIIELAYDSIFSSMVASDSSLSESDWVSPALDSGSYYWHVTASNGFGFSPRSLVRDFEVVLLWNAEAPVLTSPDDSLISSISYINFNWEEVDGAVSYLFELAADSEFNDFIFADSTIADTYYNSDSLTNNWYWWRVKASDGSEWTDYSEVWSFMVDYDTTLLNYLPGDVNMANSSWPPQVIGSDVTYLVGYFRGLPANQPCLLGGYWASADANGDCHVVGSDVTKLVNIFRGIGDVLYCPDYEPSWLTPDDLPAEAPEGWPNCDVPLLNGEK